MTVSPVVKKIASALAVGIAGSVLVTLNHFVPELPIVVQGLALSALAAAAHYVDAWGHQDRVAQIVANTQAGNPPDVPVVAPWTAKP